MQHYKDFWNRYAVFSGRTTRAGYWVAWLFNFLITFGLGLLSGVSGVFSIISICYSLAAFIPGIAICIRRLRDAGFGWGWYFLPMAPTLGLVPAAFAIIEAQSLAAVGTSVILLALAMCGCWFAFFIMLCMPTKEPAVLNTGGSGKEGIPGNMGIVAEEGTPGGVGGSGKESIPENAGGPGKESIPGGAGGSADVCVDPVFISLLCKNTSLAGKKWNSMGGALLAGRDPAACKICFPEDTAGVSREHCKIYQCNGVWCVEDLNSTYGTYVNNQRLKPGQKAKLHEGDNIFLGSQQVRLVVQDCR